MTSQSADDGTRDQSPAPIGLRELPPQPAKPAMPSYPTAPAAAAVQLVDEAGPSADGSLIACDDHFEGTFTSRGTVRVEGSVEGRIEAVRVRIQAGAHVKADVVVDEAIVAGEFDGNLTCRQRLEAQPTGRINGRIETHKLMLHEGASVEGEMHMLTEAAGLSDETIRGTAPVRGDGATPKADGSEPTRSTRVAAKPSVATATAAGQEPAPASRPAPSPRPAAAPSAKTDSATSELRVSPRTTTAASTGINGRTKNGSSAENGTSRL